METALKPDSESGQLDSAPNTLVLTQSAPLALSSSRHCSPSPELKKPHKKLHAGRGHSPTPKKDKKGAEDELRSALGHSSSPELGAATTSSIRASSSNRNPPPTPGSSRGTQHLTVPSTPEAFQVAKVCFRSLCHHSSGGETSALGSHASATNEECV